LNWFYGQEVVLPVEINLKAGRVVHQNSLLEEEYRGYMIDNIDDLTESHLEALQELEKEKIKVARASKRECGTSHF
jgi:hypothetical protein